MGKIKINVPKRSWNQWGQKMEMSPINLGTSGDRIGGRKNECIKNK